jgi:hypothetical protein
MKTIASVKRNIWSTNRYYYMYDNGTDTKNGLNLSVINYSTDSDSHKFWEKHGTWFYYGTKTVKHK